jgi:hypothetical protein
MFNYTNNYSFIHMSGCVGIIPCALLFPGVYDSAKTALTISIYIYIYVHTKALIYIPS